MSLDDDVDDLANIIGHNYCLGEIEAAIISGQLSALPRRVESRRRAAAHLISLVSRLPGVSIAQVPPNRSHAYYVLGLDVDCTFTGVNRDTLVDALRAEGIPNVMAGYQNLHRLPAVQRRVAMGASGFPWSLATWAPAGGEAWVHCPVAEELHDRSFVGLLMCSHQLDSGDCEQIGSAFAKVWNNLEALRLADAVGPPARA